MKYTEKMETKEDAYALAQGLTDILRDVALKYRGVLGKLDGSELRQQQADHIELSIDYVHKHIRPYSINIPPIDPDARRVRSFEVEHDRLMTRVMAFYTESVKNANPAIAAVLGKPANACIFHELRDNFHKQVQETTLPLLEQYPAPGDDLYLFILACMRTLDDKATLESLTKGEKTPPQTDQAFLAMLGLLMQAKRAEREQDTISAMSFLFDVNHLLGLHEGTQYVMRYLPELTKSLHGKRNAEKSHVKKSKAKRRVLELFYALRPRNGEGRPQMWQSAEVAGNAVWETLLKEATAAGKQKPQITDSTVMSVCKDLHRSDKNGRSYDVRAEVRMRLPDGSEINVPID
jgi:hypothetical protein